MSDILARKFICKQQTASRKPGFVRRLHQPMSRTKRASTSRQVSLYESGVGSTDGPSPRTTWFLPQLLCVSVLFSSQTSFFSPWQLSAPVTPLENTVGFGFASTSTHTHVVLSSRAHHRVGPSQILSGFMAKKGWRPLALMRCPTWGQPPRGDQRGPIKPGPDSRAIARDCGQEASETASAAKGSQGDKELPESSGHSSEHGVVWGSGLPWGPDCSTQRPEAGTQLASRQQHVRVIMSEEETSRGTTL